MLWDRKAAAAWFLPIAPEERSLRIMKEYTQLDLNENKQLGRKAENLRGKNLSHLRGMGKLKKLAAPRSLDDEGLYYIGQLGKLRTLYLRGNNFTIEGLKHLAQLSKLKSFATEWLPSGSEAIQILAALPSLSALALNPTDTTNEDLVHLTTTKLKELNIGCEHITGEGLKHIGKITSLENLMLGHVNTQKITDDSLKYLQGLTNLKRITLRLTEVTENGLVYLEPLSSLKKLRLKRHMCKSPEAKALKEKIPGLSIRDNA
jgi:hypothetical protein